MVWLIISIILSYSNVEKNGLSNNVLKYGSFQHFLKHIVASQDYLER